MQAYFDERAHFYHANRHLGFKLRRTWGETKRHPRLFKNLGKHQIQNYFTLHFPHILLTVVLIYKFLIRNHFRRRRSSVPLANLKPKN